MNRFTHLKYDLPAGLVVFLVALPLCLGVALASGAPLISGILSGIIGGIIVGVLSESHTSVSGPAAGLAAIVLSGIQHLNNYNYFLVAVIIAGVIQLLIGFLKGGSIASYIPLNVIKGLLSAIGLILILKQIPHAVGYDKDNKEDFSFFQQDGENTFSELLNVFNQYSLGAILISICSILILIYWEKSRFKKYLPIPTSLLVVLLGVAFNLFFEKFLSVLQIKKEHLVQLPQINDISNLVLFPSFDGIFVKEVWIIGFTIAIVASIETLLNLEAVEKLDPHKRVASPNRELYAQGIGNIVAGLIGGIPITSVIVRSSVNINAGAQSKASAITHGLLLVISVILLAPFLNLIPLASLAAILIMTGYKLVKLSIFKDLYQKGMNQFVPFIVTILAIVFTDLLIGILIGLGVSIFYLLKSNFKNPFVLQKETLHTDETYILTLPNQVSFLNKSNIKDTLWKLPEGAKIVIDAENADFIDLDVLELISDFNSTYSKEHGIKMNLIGFDAFPPLKDQIEFINIIDKNAQQKISPDEVLSILEKGNHRFMNGVTNEKYLKHQAKATVIGQNPIAIVLSCIDSRTTTEHIFDLGLGDIFSVRIAGNVLNEDILGSMEFAVHEIGVKLVLVLGHTKCSAVAGACNHVQLDNLTHLLEKINPAIEAEKSFTENRNGSNYQFVNAVAKEHVLLTLEKIREESKIIREAESKGIIKLCAAMYELESGKVHFL